MKCFLLLNICMKNSTLDMTWAPWTSSGHIVGLFIGWERKLGSHLELTLHLACVVTGAKSYYLPLGTLPKFSKIFLSAPIERVRISERISGNITAPLLLHSSMSQKISLSMGHVVGHLSFGSKVNCTIEVVRSHRLKIVLQAMHNCTSMTLMQCKGNCKLDLVKLAGGPKSILLFKY